MPAEVEQIRERFGDRVNIYERSVERAYVEVAREDIREIAEYIFRDMGARFATATGSDTRRGFEIIYHFAFDKSNLFVSLRVIVPKDEPWVDSITPIITGAKWIEREMWEMIGIEFPGHPKMERLLSAADRPEGFHPYRRNQKHFRDRYPETVSSLEVPEFYQRNQKR